MEGGGPGGAVKVQLSTGTIIAARYADKLRKVALALLKRQGVPTDAIIRDVSELNRRLFEELSGRGIGKLDVIRITVEAEYSPGEGRVKFSNLRISRYLPEESCAQSPELQRKLEELQEENRRLRGTLEEIRSKLQLV